MCETNKVLLFYLFLAEVFIEHGGKNLYFEDIFREKDLYKYNHYKMLEVKDLEKCTFTHHIYRNFFMK